MEWTIQQEIKTNPLLEEAVKQMKEDGLTAFAIVQMIQVIRRKS